MKKKLFKSPFQLAFILLLAGGLLTACNDDSYNTESTEDSLHNNMTHDSGMMMTPGATDRMGTDSMMMNSDTGSMRRTPIDSGNRIAPN